MRQAPSIVELRESPLVVSRRCLADAVAVDRPVVVRYPGVATVLLAVDRLAARRRLQRLQTAEHQRTAIERLTAQPG